MKLSNNIARVGALYMTTGARSDAAAGANQRTGILNLSEGATYRAQLSLLIILMMLNKQLHSDSMSVSHPVCLRHSRGNSQ